MKEGPDGSLGGLAAGAGQSQSGPNLKWAVSMGTWWHHMPRDSFTQVLDVMKDTGYTGIRLTGFPGCLAGYNLTTSALERELSKRGLRIATLSFGGPADDPTKHEEMEQAAREALSFLQHFGATELVVMSPARVPKVLIPEHLRIACQFYNHLGDVAAEYGIKAGMHHHLDQQVESQDEVELFLDMADPARFHFVPDTAHLHLAGCNVLEVFQKYVQRAIFVDFKDAKLTPATEDLHLPNGQVHEAGGYRATFMNSIYDLGDGEIDFLAVMRILKENRYQGWICVDLDHVRVSPRHSYGRSMEYVRGELNPIYA